MEFPRYEEYNERQNRLGIGHQYHTLEGGFTCSKQRAHLNNKKSVYPEIVSPYYGSPLAWEIGQLTEIMRVSLHNGEEAFGQIDLLATDYE